MSKTKFGPGPQFDVVITRRRSLTQDIVHLTFERLDGLEFPHWEPGAHIELALFSGLQRQYSLCGDPRDKKHMKIAVLLQENSRGGSKHIHREVRESSVVSARGPMNHFPLKSSDSYLFLAGGIGITPILPMIYEAERRGAEWKLMYLGRDVSSMAFVAELTQTFGPKVVAMPKTAGRVDLAELLGSVPMGVHLYVCGPARLLDTTVEITRGWPLGSVHMERFSPPIETDDASDASFEVEMAASGRVVRVAESVSILEALERAGVSVPSVCREGTCGSCETTVLAGIPDHRDHVLSPSERATADTMMICVSRCKGSRLVLDL